MFRPIASIFALFFCLTMVNAEETFIMINGLTNEHIVEFGPHSTEQVSPCSTFKIPLSLMGFDSKILQDATTPTWNFQEGYVDFLESWKSPQTPLSWMKLSCVWYSQVLTTELGLDNFRIYLAAFNYGNQDVSGGLTQAWLASSLKISPQEQVGFLQQMVQGKLPVSSYALEMTKTIMRIDVLDNGWTLYGKTGWGGSTKPDGINEIGWFIGWIEKNASFFPFAYQVRSPKIDLAQRVPRVKALLRESHIMTKDLFRN